MASDIEKFTEFAEFKKLSQLSQLGNFLKRSKCFLSAAKYRAGKGKSPPSRQTEKISLRLRAIKANFIVSVRKPKPKAVMNRRF